MFPDAGWDMAVFADAVADFYATPFVTGTFFLILALALSRLAINFFKGIS